MSARFHFMASRQPVSRNLAEEMICRYGQTDLAHASCVVAVGGDGTTLKALSVILGRPDCSVFAMTTPGSVGALGNEAGLEDLMERVASADRLRVAPLIARVTRKSSAIETVIGFNEVTISRQNFQAVRLQVRLSPAVAPLVLYGDGLLIATPLGSTGYCRSFGGARIRIGSGLLSLAGMALRSPTHAFRTVVEDNSLIGVEVLDAEYRPVRVETHTATLEDVVAVDVACSDQFATLLKDAAKTGLCAISVP